MLPTRQHASIPSAKTAHRIQKFGSGETLTLPQNSRAAARLVPWEGLPPAWPIFNSQKAADHFTPPPFSFSTPRSPPLPAHAS